MSPGLIKQIGPEFERKDGTKVKPKALFKWCEVCGFEGATFGDFINGKRVWYCGFVDGKAACIGKKTT